MKRIALATLFLLSTFAVAIAGPWAEPAPEPVEGADTPPM